MDTVQLTKTSEVDHEDRRLFQIKIQKMHFNSLDLLKLKVKFKSNTSYDENVQFAHHESDNNYH